MAVVLIRRTSVSKLTSNSYSWLQCSNVSLLRGSIFFGHDRGYSVSNRLSLSPFFPENDKDNMKECKVQIMDDETWLVSSSLLDAWRGNEKGNALKMSAIFSDQENDGDFNGVVVDSVVSNKEGHDFDEIEDMRIRGNLFYKLDKDSKEYQEYSFDFHRRKSHKNVKDCKESKETKKSEIATKVEKASKKNEQREIKKSKECKMETMFGRVKDEYLISRLHEMGNRLIDKKQRTLTFNQQTAPYHEPFCLDIYISKGSVRASIIHRATSNVVMVSHSISKDMKFDLSSTKNRNACAAVGEVLAQRALADDIHNVVYTPRKGEKLEGKLQIVLRSIIDGGINVKVKLKQKKLRKATGLPSRTRY
ncbi:hypothetical protein ACJIZ3_013882 [Penstemon smallii]|uniref:Ribosomal protein L18 n=1 Tax=Penstemon smallii TaxID=265156 RepID=A0ABD3RI35_9LAMI